jgi:hypothetical protein
MSKPNAIDYFNILHQLITDMGPSLQCWEVWYSWTEVDGDFLVFIQWRFTEWPPLGTKTHFCIIKTEIPALYSLHSTGEGTNKITKLWGMLSHDCWYRRTPGNRKRALYLQMWLWRSYFEGDFNL